MDSPNLRASSVTSSSERIESCAKREARPPLRPITTHLSLSVDLLAPSAQRVDRVVLQLQGLSDLLRSEGERVNREIAGYINLNGHATSAMQVISAALNKLNDAIPRRRA